MINIVDVSSSTVVGEMLMLSKIRFAQFDSPSSSF